MDNRPGPHFPQIVKTDKIRQLHLVYTDFLSSQLKRWNNSVKKKEILLISGGGLALIILSAGITFAIVGDRSGPKTTAAVTPTPQPKFFSLGTALNVCEKRVKERFGNDLLATLFDHRRSRLIKTGGIDDNGDEVTEDFYLISANIETREEAGLRQYGLLCEVIAETNEIRMFKLIKAD